MSSDPHEITQTIPARGGPRSEGARQGALVVVGDGASLATLAAPRLFPMTAPTLEIGRRPPTAGPASLTLADGTVSALHARIQRSGDRSDLYVIQDLGSTNGTFVNGRRLRGPAPLGDGAVLFLGSQVLVFRLYTAAEMNAVNEDALAPLTPVATLSPALASTTSKLRRLARSDSEILLVGETGVGKDVFAAAVHALSGRLGKLIAVNCAAIPRELVESELYGYEKGAHSTAQARKTGLVEAADGGTLFLDEIGDMPIELQSKLLRFLQDRRFSPLGSTRVVEADVRIIAATSRVALDKGAHVQEAMLGRLGAQPILLPPLRERIEDLGRLAAYFLREVSDGRTFEPDAFKALMLHDWPLNVRELSKVITEAEVLSRSTPTIGFEHLPSNIATKVQYDLPDDLEDTTVDPEPSPAADDGTGSGVVREQVGPAPTTRVRRPAPTRDEIVAALAASNGSVAQVARRMSRQYAVVWRIIQRYGIDAGAFRKDNGDGSDNNDNEGTT
ncbi:MAG TPA: sigma 54-interacting transcriptional regulator [Polyangia bacterium]|nr:sigma 54-interacting transcriptional regulator [Polyangia bacterium]